jgi:hypothetical protein
MSVDPWDPALPLFGIKEVMDACEGTASITLGSLTHVVQIDLEGRSSSQPRQQLNVAALVSSCSLGARTLMSA